MLDIAVRQFPMDWKRREEYRPMLLDTFVEVPWTSTCYRAATRQYLSETVGRGGQDRDHAAAVIKTLWVYPLACHLSATEDRETLQTEPVCGPQSPASALVGNAVSPRRPRSA